MDRMPASEGKSGDTSLGRWSLLQRREVADCRVFKVFEEHLKNEGRDQEGTFFVIEAKSWVLAVALTPEREMILVRQFRYGSKDFSLEVPGGVMDPEDASPETTARRELREETGYTGGPASLLGWSFPNPALQQNKAYFVLIEDCRLTHPPKPDLHEDLELVILPQAEVRKMAESGEISHALAINALFHFFLRET